MSLPQQQLRYLITLCRILSTTFLTFFKAICCYVIDYLCVTSYSRSQLDYSTILEHKCQQLFQTFFTNYSYIVHTL